MLIRFQNLGESYAKSYFRRGQSLKSRFNNWIRSPIHIQNTSENYRMFQNIALFPDVFSNSDSGHYGFRNEVLSRAFVNCDRLGCPFCKRHSVPPATTHGVCYISCRGEYSLHNALSFVFFKIYSTF